VLDLRRIRVEAVYMEKIETRAMARTSGGVGPVRHPVGAHAPGEFPHAVQQLLQQGLWTVAGLKALGDRRVAVFGSTCMQALSATWNWEVLTPSCCAGGDFPPGSRSGKFGTPWERMQREKASLPFCGADAAEALELLFVAVEPSCAT
jgi:hypothetical protein